MGSGDLIVSQAESLVTRVAIIVMSHKSLSYYISAIRFIKYVKIIAIIVFEKQTEVESKCFDEMIIKKYKLFTKV